MAKKWYEIKAKSAQRAEIMIYDEIGIWGISAKQFNKDLKALGDVKIIDLHLNSPGGSVIEGNAIYNALRSHKAKINIFIDGLAASMASVIAMAGDTVSMAENALFMIHNPFGMAFGDAEEMRKTADVMDKMKATMVKSYSSKVDLDDAAISELMDNESWFNADEALDAGFIDEVTDKIEVGALYDIDKYGFVNKPEDFDKCVGAKPALLSKEQIGSIVDQINDAVDSDRLVIAASLDKSVAADTTTGVNTMLTEEERKAAEAKAKAEKEAKAAEAKAAADALALDTQRQTEITAIFKPHGEAHKKLMQECVLDKTISVEDASAKLLTALGKGAAPVATEDVRIQLLADSRDKFRAQAIEAIEIRSGVTKDNGDNEFRGSTLLEIAKASLIVGNVPFRGLDKMRIVAEAFTHSSSDFPYLLENTLGKVLRNAYGNFAETWAMWCDIGSVPDFKINSRIQLGSFNSLDLIPEGGEYKAGTFGEEAEQIQAATKGKKISLTRQMIINDDLNGFMRIAKMMGRAAARTVGNDAYALLISNPTMSDSVALFENTAPPAGHGNLPTGAVPSATSLGAARTIMRKQKDSDLNDYLNIQPKVILAGVEQEDSLNILIASETDPSQANSKKPNPVRNIAELITDPRLGATEWYMIADPNEAPVIEVAFLDGNQTPYLESRNGFNIDGVEWKVRLDYGLSAIDWRGGVKGNA